MARIINFFDGAESSTTPTIGNLVASNLVQYASDAAYEAAEAGSPTGGNIYYNTTDGQPRYYDDVDMAWKPVPETAVQVAYDNAGSGLTATDVQAAIDEVEGRVDTNETNISTNQTNISTNATDIDDLETLSGSPGATDHGTFTGTTIPDNSDTREALQSLETEVESKIDTSEKGAINGVATLDGSGTIPSSQLPTSLMEYQGDWDADTNSPTLANTDTGVQGNVYRVTVAGTTDFGAGGIAFAVGDWAYNNGSTWEKSDEQTLPDTDALPEGATNLYNQTHTGEVTGATALTVDPTAITNKTTVTPESGDFFLFSDTSDGGNLKKADFDNLGGGGSSNTSNALVNVGITASAAAGALTIALKQSDGTSDPTSGSPVQVALRSTTITIGGYTIEDYDAAASVVVPSTGTLGYANGHDAKVYVYVIFDGSNKEIAVSSVYKDPKILHDTTAVGVGSDASNLYSTSARTGCAVRLIGRVDIDAITTAGTWTAPDRVVLSQGQDNLEEEEYYVASLASGSVSTTTADTFVDVTGINIELPPGDWILGHVSSLQTRNNTGGNLEVLVQSAIRNSFNSVQVDSVGYLSNNLSANRRTAATVSNNIEVSIDQAQTYKLSIKCSQSSANGQAFAFSANFTGSFTDPDATTKIWARRIVK